MATRIYIQFVDLSHEELEQLLNLEKKMKITNGEWTGSGFHIPTRTRDWSIEPKSGE